MKAPIKNRDAMISLLSVVVLIIIVVTGYVDLFRNKIKQVLWKRR